MKYYDDTEVTPGDIVSVPIPEGAAKARIVMLGDTYDHLPIDEQFLNWVKTDKVLKESSVVEWLSDNPFANDDQQYAPVGNYMFAAIDEWNGSQNMPNPAVKTAPLRSALPISTSLFQMILSAINVNLVSR